MWDTLSYIVINLYFKTQKNICNHLVCVILICLPDHHIVPEPRYRHYSHSVDEVDRAEGCQGDEPEPQSHVDLLIDNVESQDTESVLLLNGSWQ